MFSNMGRTQRVLAVLVLHIALARSFSWDFVIARSNKLEFYNEGTLAYTAAPASHPIKWIIHDPVRDRVLFADSRSSKMSAASFDIATNITQPLIMKKTKRYFKRFAYDPATELLFGSRENKIYSFSIKSGNKNKVTHNGDLVIDLESAELRQLAVDSCGGYIYWTASNTIERALFNGSDREVVIGKGLTAKQGLTIDTQKIYWIEAQEYNGGGFSIEIADLNGKNRRTLYIDVESDFIPDKVFVSKYFVYWRDGIETAFVWQFPKNPSNGTNVKPSKISIPLTSDCCNGFQDIAANYNIEDRIQGVPNCHALKNLLPGYFDCVNGRKVIGESRCECAQGYLGVRCDVSVCHNYCYQGDCDVTDGGQPKCSCNAGYSGERCEVSLCHDYCLNNGTFSLTNYSEPVCDCTGPYQGERCEVPICKDYCFQGECTVSAEGQPKCRCDTGYSGKRCEVSPCHDYCLNNSTCSLNNHSEPVCDCTGPYQGERCEIPSCKDYCFRGECSVSAERLPKCRCDAGYSGERCEVSPCHDYCLNNGICYLTRHSEPVCICPRLYRGKRCDVSVCKDYCFQGECTVSAEGQPKCRCDAGYSGERCEVSPCHDYCLNNGICYLTRHSEPVCICPRLYRGKRCDVSVCKDYCFQGECTVSAEGQPKCSCNAGYSGERCEVSLCHDYCLNNGTCSLTNNTEPDCYDGFLFVANNGTTTTRVCTVSAEGEPKCSCNAGYSGERCEVSPCHDYCLNTGTCSLTNHSEPVCACEFPYEGDRCQDLSVSTTEIPIVYTETTSPIVYTETTSPIVYTETTSPIVYTETTSPIVYTETTSQKSYHDKFHWLPIVNGTLPPNAIIGGFEEEDTYIARANEAGSLCLGKYVPSHGRGYIPWGGKELSESEESIEILCGTNAIWVKISPGNSSLPANVFEGGRTGRLDEFDGEPLYVGRDMIGGDRLLGKVHLRYHSCYFPYHGKEITKRSCEILVQPDDEI